MNCEISAADSFSEKVMQHNIVSSQFPFDMIFFWCHLVAKFLKTQFVCFLSIGLDYDLKLDCIKKGWIAPKRG